MACNIIVKITAILWMHRISTTLGYFILTNSGKSKVSRPFHISSKILHSPKRFITRYAVCGSSHLSLPSPDADDESPDTSPMFDFDGPIIYGFGTDSDGRVQLTPEQMQKKAISLSSGKPVSANSRDDDAPSMTTPSPEKKKSVSLQTLLEGVPIRSREVPLLGTTEDENENALLAVAKVWEMERPGDVVQDWMMQPSSDQKSFKKSKSDDDPFGVVMWPGSILAARKMYETDIVRNRTVLVLGSGTGVEVQAACMFGAQKVIATDVNKFTLSLLRYGVERMGFDDIVEICEFDIGSSEPLPPADVVVAADMLYDEQLASFVLKRCQEVLSSSSARTSLDEGNKDEDFTKESYGTTTMIVTDSQKFHGTDFLEELRNSQQSSPSILENLKWEEKTLHNVTGSGILIEEDQTYDVKARVLVF